MKEFTMLLKAENIDEKGEKFSSVYKTLENTVKNSNEFKILSFDICMACEISSFVAYHLKYVKSDEELFSDFMHTCDIFTNEYVKPLCEECKISKITQIYNECIKLIHLAIDQYETTTLQIESEELLKQILS